MARVVQEERERPYKSMEQRMAAYRQECEARLQEEVQRQVRTLFSVPLQGHQYLAVLINAGRGYSLSKPRVGISMHQNSAVNTRSWHVAACGTNTVMSCHTAYTPAQLPLPVPAKHPARLAS